MICECTIKENSFVGPYDVMLVLQYSLITSFVSIIFHNYLSQLFVIVFSYLYTFLGQIVEEKGYRFKIKIARK